tara:strand:+ start:21684 stop:23939 length:2256 start_codon:yes stop_codon:yes gene_type:complete
MSAKKTSIDWDAFMGESQLPADEFTWTDGSNYGLDGFHHEQTMGEGLNHETLPGATPGGIKDTTIGMQSCGDIPDEMMGGHGHDVSFVDTDPLHVVEDGFNLTAMLDESALPLAEDAKKTVSLADLDWLDPTKDQDPERLPKQPHGITIPGLEDAWGKEFRTDGVSLVPNKDRETAQYNESIRSPVPALPGARAAAEKFEPAVRRAIRRSHYGHPLKAIAQELVDTLGNDPRLVTVMERIGADHGLAGTVFINANAFPGLKNGKWVKELKKSARSASFVLTDDQVVAQKLGKLKTSGLDWAKVLAVYKPRLEAAGYKLASGNPKEVLRRAFLMGPAPKEAATGHKPIDVRPADTISAADAFGRMAAAGKAEVKVIESMERRAFHKKRLAVMHEVRKWAEAGRITEAEALRLATSKLHPNDIRHALAAMVTVQASGEYDGTGKSVPKDAHVLRAAAIKSLDEKEAALEAGLRKKFASQLAKQVGAGLLTTAEAKAIFAMQKPVHELQRIATMAIQTAGQKRKVTLEAAEKRDYKGHEFKPATQKVASMPKLSAYQQKVIAHGKATGIDPREFFALLKFASKEMNEGMMGQNLTAMLGVRFTPELLRAAAPLVSELRKQHEGLAGTVYVDASAYASGTGAKGCEKGALKHRANQVKTVLAMDRCGGCVHASEGSCNIYGKPLIQSAAEVVGDAAAVQQRMLHLADAPDAEVTASLFTPSEFNLTSAMDNLDLTELGSTEKLSEIMFGGLILEE